jgi:hypothetical protein
MATIVFISRNKGLASRTLPRAVSNNLEHRLLIFSQDCSRLILQLFLTLL